MTISRENNLLEHEKPTISIAIPHTENRYKVYFFTHVLLLAVLAIFIGKSYFFNYSHENKKNQEIARLSESVVKLEKEIERLEKEIVDIKNNHPLLINNQLHMPPISINNTSPPIVGTNNPGVSSALTPQQNHLPSLPAFPNIESIVVLPAPHDPQEFEKELGKPFESAH